jgi:hypothetical protein
MSTPTADQGTKDSDFQVVTFYLDRHEILRASLVIHKEAKPFSSNELCNH